MKYLILILVIFLVANPCSASNSGIQDEAPRIGAGVGNDYAPGLLIAYSGMDQRNADISSGKSGTGSKSLVVNSSLSIARELASVWHISPAGNDETGDGSEENPFKTIQRGIDTASAGDTVLAHEGIYYERISFLGKAIAVGSEYMYDTNTSHILNTIIDGDTSQVEMLGDTGSVVRFVNGEDSTAVLLGFTIQNGVGTYGNGGGIYFDGGSPKIFNCIIKSNAVDGNGGGIYAGSYEDQPYFFQCEISGNTSDKGGGMAFEYPIAAIDSCNISYNTANRVGGILIFNPPFKDDSPIGISSCTVEKNNGDGIVCPPGFSFDIFDCEVDSNSGTGIAIDNSRNKYNKGLNRFPNHISRCTISGNNVGLILYEQGQIFVDGCLIENNNGGGIRVGSDAGLVLTNSQLIGNGDASLAGGGAIRCNYLSFFPLNISNCLFANNAAQAGGAIHMHASDKFAEDRSTHTIESCTFVSNYADTGSSIYGGGIYTLDINQCIFAFGNQGEAIYCTPPIDTTLVNFVSCTDIYGNEGGDWVGCMEEFDSINGNFSLNPEFCELGSGDYHIYNTSPCAPENNSCDTLIGMYGVGCYVAEITALEIEGDSAIMNVTNHIPEFIWDYTIPRDFTPTHFEIDVASNSDFDPVDMWNPDPFESTDTFVVYDGLPLIDGETYYVRLKLGDDGVWTSWYDTLFRMNSVPSIPVLTSPINDAFTDSQPLLSLQASTDAENDVLYYIFRVLDDEQNIITTSPQILGLDNWTAEWQCDVELIENEYYSWGAKATDNYEESEWSPFASFYVNAVNTAPLAFDLILPPDTKALFSNLVTPAFAWEASIDDDPLDTILYTLQLATDSDFYSVNEVDSIYSTEYELAYDLDLGDKYWWKVRAKDISGDSVWSSETFSFWTKRCGDANNDDTVDVSDAVYIINYIFLGGLEPIPYEAGDANCDDFVNVSDAVWIIKHVFLNGNLPCDVDGDSIQDC